MSPWLLLVASLFATGNGLATRFSTEELARYSFSRFVKDFGRSYQRGSEEWAMRKRLFHQRMQEVRDFHAGPPRSYKKGITRFMDYTDAEYKSMLGYKGSRSRKSSGVGAIELFTQREHSRVLPAFIDVGSNSSLGAIVRDQGSCGSCWAEATVAVLESHMEKNKEVMAVLADPKLLKTQTLATLSTQAVVSCTENPHHCGGKGGCEGATGELAFSMVKEKGIPLAVAWPYTSGNGNTPTCRDDVFQTPKLGIAGYEVLPANKLAPLKRALVDSGGPIVISVDASNWALYNAGIFSDTEGGKPGDFTVNHAVTLMGFMDPTSDQRGYWLVKNSWGPYWGEQGFIRLEMKPNEEEHCGWDYNTHDGLACDGDPNTAWVCGTCGILYDSSYPYGLHLKQP